MPAEGVEVIGGEPILDLTTPTTQVPEVEPAAKPEDGDTTTDGTVTVDGESETVAVEEPSTPTAEPEFYFGDTRVTVDVPPEVEQSLKDVGLESADVLNELFGKGSDFSLKPETREKLDAKYGKAIVDSYLNMFKTLNLNKVKEHEASVVSEQEKIASQHAEYNETVGGLDGLEAIEAYILQNMNEKQIKSYNAVMSGDSHEAHMLVLSSIKGEMEAKAKAAAGDSAITLIGDDSSSAPSKVDPLSSGAITRDTYYELMATPEYQKNPAYQQRVDAARMQGKRKGI